MLALKCKSREKRQTLIEKQEEDWNFNRAELPLQVSVYCTVREESKRRQRSFRFIRLFSSRDGTWFHTSAVAVLHVSRRCQDYLVGKFPTILKQPQQHWKIDMMVWGLSKEVNKLSWWKRLKVLLRIAEQWWEMNQEMTLRWETLVMWSS